MIRMRLAGLMVAGWSMTANAAPIFRHVVIVFQENRTPDNLFGSNPTFEPGVDIASSGVNSKGQTIPLMPVPLASCYDLAHTHTGFEVSLNQGFDLDKVKALKRCTVPTNPQFKYVDNSQGIVQPYFNIALNYGFANRMFQTNQGPSFPAHQFIFGGTSAPSTDSSLFAAENIAFGNNIAGCIAEPTTTVRLIDGYGNENKYKPIYPCFEHPTLSDLLDAATISWRYYAPTPGLVWTAPNAIQHICQPGMVNGALVCNGPDWTNGDVVPNNPAQVLTDISNCALPSVTWVIPTAAESDHGISNKGVGPQWVASVVNAIGNQPTCATGENYWNDTAIIITWDDWGGWFDHVKPFVVNQRPNSPPAWGDGYTYGFRVPMMVVSAYTPAGFVDNTILDFGNILYFVEQNFGLGFIGPGTTIYSNYADYQSQSRGAMSEYFSLNSARIFVPIPTRMTARDFIDAPKSSEPPDDE